MRNILLDWIILGNLIFWLTVLDHKLDQFLAKEEDAE